MRNLSLAKVKPRRVPELLGVTCMLLSAVTLVAPTRSSADETASGPASPQTQATAEPEPAAIPMPELPLATLSGGKAELASYRGRVLLVNFWTTWCPPCRREIPELNELYRELREEGLVILGVSDEEPEVIGRFLEIQPISYPVLRLTEAPPHPVSEVYGSFPTTFIVTKDGFISHVFVGRPAKADMLAAIKPLL